MEKGQQLYEGKAKKVFQTADDNLYVVQYKDDATAFNGDKRGSILGKGIVNNRMSNLFFQLLSRHGIKTHFVEQLSERETVVRAVLIIPVEVVVRNLAAGSMAKRLGLEEGQPLSRPIVEFYYKADELGDPLVTEDHVEVLGWASRARINEIKLMAFQVNEILGGFLLDCGVRLVDFKLEFGEDIETGELLLADEISPDTCRYWDVNTNEKLDKDRFRRDLGNVEDAYQEMLRRVETAFAKA